MIILELEFEHVLPHETLDKLEDNTFDQIEIHL